MALLFLSLYSTLYGETGIPGYAPLTGRDRVNWILLSTAGPESLAGGAFSAGFGTLVNQPPEYGTHWEGFAKRYGMRLTGISTSNAMEAGFGAVWGEDPRYFRAPGEPVKARIGHAIEMTFLDRNKSGTNKPAYARYIGVTGSNFLSNTWRPDSEATAGRASLRILLGFLGRMSGNLFEEFWPDVKQRLSRK